MVGGRVAVAVLLATLSAACVPGEGALQHNAKGEVAIAAAMPVAQADVLATMKGVRFALERNPSVRGYGLTLRPFDNSLAGLFDPAKALQNLKQIINDPAILGIVGPSNSLQASYEIPLANKASLAMISPATNDCLTLALPSCPLPPPQTINPTSFFRVAAPDRFQGTAMADFASGDLKLRRVAVITDGGNFGSRLADVFSRRFTGAGGTVVHQASFQAFTTTDFIPLLHGVRESNPEAIYVGAGAPNTCMMRAQMKDVIATDIYFLGSDGILGDQCLKYAATNLSPRMVATTPAPRQRASRDAKAIVDAYRKAYPRPEDTGNYTFAGYDSALTLIDAIGRAIDANGGRLPSRAQVLRAVAQTTDLEGVTGTWSFDANGDPRTSTISLYHVQRGQWTYFADVAVKAP